jgi:hypothetical protein
MNQLKIDYIYKYDYQKTTNLFIMEKILSVSTPKSFICKSFGKTLLSGFTVLMLAVLPPACKNSDLTKEGEVSIIESKTEQEPEVNLASHKNGDVEVYRISFKDTTGIFGSGIYSVRYFHKENDTLRYHKAWFSTGENFDQATYNWLNDTTVTVRLYNSQSKNEKKYTLFGYGRSSGIKQN